MKKYILFTFLILMPLTLFAQRKYPTGITPYTLIRIYDYLYDRDVEKISKLLRNLGYKKTSHYEKWYDYDDAMHIIDTYKRNTNNGYGSVIIVDNSSAIETISVSVTFYTSKGSTYFVNLLKTNSNFKRFEDTWGYKDGTWTNILQSGRKFTVYVHYR